MLSKWCKEGGGGAAIATYEAALLTALLLSRGGGERYRASAKADKSSKGRKQSASTHAGLPVRARVLQYAAMYAVLSYGRALSSTPRNS